jgi:NAD+ synthase (glutamine-hydrolysing)
MKTLTIVMAQINLLVGDVEGNGQLVIDATQKAITQYQADIVLFPELTLSAYPPEDLLFRKGFQHRIDAMIDNIASHQLDTNLVFGAPQLESGKRYNSAVVLRRGGSDRVIYHKQHLPNYSVFDEKRYFEEGLTTSVITLEGVRFALTICEDLWVDGMGSQLRQAGAQAILNLNASPFHIGKSSKRLSQIGQCAVEAQAPVFYCNLIGGQDELVFDGGSMVINAAGQCTRQAHFFEERLIPVTLTCQNEQVSIEAQPWQVTPELAMIYQALVTGVKDYVHKNGFKGVVLGLSGGIDSALTLAIAVDALGGDAVEAVSMPSRYTADMSIEDAQEQAQKSVCEFKIIPIEKSFNAFIELLSEEFAGKEVDTTEENIQARCRGVLLMAISNKKGLLVLTTGNKSEMSVGYATLYGDMAGGFAVLKDVPKMLVYQLAEYRNSLSPVIPRRVIERPPSAELAPDQKDSDSLPEYPILDAILEAYIEKDQCIADIVADGFDESVVRRIVRLIDINEYKRRQAAPGVKITERAFGRDRRYPITSGFGRNIH